jgi:hypothetical protein
MNTLGAKKTFHTQIVWNMPTVTSTGRISGRTILQYIRTVPQPSIRAASIISYGIVSIVTLDQKITEYGASTIYDY